MAKRYLHLLTTVLIALFPAILTAQTTAETDSAAPADTVAPVKKTSRASHRKSSHKTVAIISSFTQDSPWSNNYIPKLTMEVTGMPNVSCDIFYLNSSLITDSISYNKVKDNLFKYFSDKTPDYVVMIGKMAFCMREEMKKEWGDVPMFMIANSASMATLTYYMSGEEVEDETESVQVQQLSDFQKEYNFTAIVVPYQIKETIGLMMETMRHEINEIVFVAIPTYLERNNSIRMAEYLSVNYPGIKYSWLTADAGNVERLRTLMADRQPGTGILLANWAVQTDGPFGYPIISNQETKLMSSSVNPIFVLSSSLIDNGAVGGAFCNPDDVNDHISYLMREMLSGKNMGNIPIYICNKSKKVINFKKAQEYGLSLNNLGKDVEYINKSRNFWQKYHWQAIIAAIVLALLIIVFWKRSQLQAREIRNLQLHRKFIDSMPIAYGHAALYLAADGKHVNNVMYSNLNDAMQDLIKKNGCKTGEYVLFPIDFMHEKAKELFDKGHKIDFVHHFENTDTYYDVFVDLVDSESHHKQANIRELDIFAVDVTNRVRMEKDLKEMTRKLDLTINVAGIIPWEWDIKTDVMRFDAYSLFGRQLHDVDDIQQDTAPYTYLDVYTEFMPLIHPDDKGELEKVRKAILTKDQTSFTLRYRLKIARDNKDMYQWVEARGSITEFDENGNPAICSGAMWKRDDDIVDDPMY